jgi:hypothetical protein
MRFGASIVGRLKASTGPVVVLPTVALFDKAGKPAVWVVDTASGSVSLKEVGVSRYETIASSSAAASPRATSSSRPASIACAKAEGAPRRGSLQMTSSFNLSDWALRHKSFVIYLMLVSAIAGLMAYNGLGREEDPPFTIKTMVIKTLWPGATTTETINQITDRIEKKLEEVPHLDFVRSYTKPGESVVFVNLKDSVRASEVPDLWYQVRKKVGDIRQNLPSGIYGPYFNDEFGDTYSIIYALTTDGFSRREVRDYAERIRTELLRVPDVAKVDLIGVQDEKSTSSSLPSRSRRSASTSMRW